MFSPITHSELQLEEQSKFPAFMVKW